MNSEGGGEQIKPDGTRSFCRSLATSRTPQEVGSETEGKLPF